MPAIARSHSVAPRLPGRGSDSVRAWPLCTLDTITDEVRSYGRGPMKNAAVPCGSAAFR